MVRRRSPVFAAVLSMTVTLGCASEPRKSAANPFAIERVPYPAFDVSAMKGSGFAHVEVRFARAPEVSHVWPNSLFEGLGAGAGLTAAGVGVTLLNPFAGGAVVGGVLVTPIWVTLGIMNENARTSITTALREVDFPNRLQGAIQSRLAKGSSGGPDSHVKLEILILGYGLLRAGSREDWFCFSFDGEVKVTAADQVLYQDRVLMEPYRRSLDVPPPRCASLYEFGEDNGKVARETLVDASEVLAAVILRRVGAKP